MNKKGQIEGVIFFIVLLFIILFVGFLMATGGALVNWVFDEAVPELSNLGAIGDANMTQIADQTITPANTLVQSSTYIFGVMYFIMLIASIGFAFTLRESPSKWLIGFYIMLVLILVLGSMFMSNIYEDFYTGTDEMATRLQEQTLLSYMILYSPTIFAIMGFITGIIIFSGREEEFT